ncbi:MAG TPA: PaaI family thioesterase [Acidimicrobiales bacterium]|nr:PaaI family thioesterase [Acidimicrobiales bacterium]
MNEVPKWTFGEAPLAETVALAAALRDLAGKALALEQPTPEIRQFTAEVVALGKRLEAILPSDHRPRVGPLGPSPGDDRRVYLDHSRDIGDYNPCFPQYRLSCADDRGEGEVDFPDLYEGPPGIVHGGFLALLFDCVLQQLNCDLGVAGKTMNINVRYRRPTPLRTKLRIVATREIADKKIHSKAQLYREDELLCEAEMTAVAGNRESLPYVSPRRPPG